MTLRHRADWRTLAWAFGLMPAFVIAQYRWPMLAGWFLPLAMYGSYSAAVIAHNHNHCPTFVSRRQNQLFSSWISVFYGFPTYGWIPTHNENHHRYAGRPGDATVLVDPSQPDSAWLALTHFFRSTRTQGPLLLEYRRRLRKRSRRAWLSVWLEYGIVFGGHAAMLALALAAHGARRGLFVYASALGIPAFTALWGIMFTNWVQHVGCDPGSRWNHSRNFVSPWMNALVFDNGFHTVHHERPGLHWSVLRGEHAKIAHLLEPRCESPSIFHYALVTYCGARLRRVLGALSSHSLRSET
jgi:beta-carotene hydroxylase